MTPVLGRVGAADASALLRRPARGSNGAHVVGALFLLGALLSAMSLVFPHPHHGEVYIWGVVVTASLIGAALFVTARRVTNPVLQGAVGAGSALINLMMLASGVATGVYAGMFCWVVLVSVNFFTLRVALIQFAWMMGTYAAVLTQVESSGGYSGLTRWLTSTMALAVTGAAGAWLVFRRRLAEEETRSFLVLAKEMLCAIDAEDRFERLNPAWERVLGHAPATLRDTPFLDLVHPLDRTGTGAVVDSLRNGAGAVTIDIRCRAADGSWRPLRWEVSLSQWDKLVYARVRPIRADGDDEAADPREDLRVEA
jgi:PAS domain S-box-containing protein